MGTSAKMATKPQIDNTYSEAFTGIFSRVIITADDETTLRQAAEDSTAVPGEPRDGSGVGQRDAGRG